MASGKDDARAPLSNAWRADHLAAAAAETSFSGDFSPKNVDVVACNYYEEGHFARNCPSKKDSGQCYSCGEIGYNKAECQNPRVEREFTGGCNFCGQPSPSSCRRI
ncbi:hypothetical protein KC318_g551 [Hortaea werneckii]|nr:hypothetical protein KC334_g754 [Hortaea werneckii]KAI7026154.1 hypothetical protein KC355_g747 [Hortaea werneckii]KAI7187335.1 hypothetical protein KC324_g6944 [Hortaea werneckii]KAI7584830.1 hypothetical protein KC316_g6475 [Hortaea werneckii]KAI7675999.1 hypothetical protein KC318_g551 [Hortaea werneckii]